MAPRIGYLLPTREAVMQGRPETGPLLALAERAEALGYDAVWVGDSLLARPRHDPLTLLAAVAARTRRVMVGTAVFLPALRNPVVLAHQLATLDRISEGRLVLGAGIATDGVNVRAEFAAAGVPFEGRVGRMMEGLRLARSADGVPAFRERNEAPRQLVVVGSPRRLIESRRVGQKILLQGRRNSRSHGVQQSVEFNFAHRALLHSRANGAKSLLFPD